MSKTLQRAAAVAALAATAWLHAAAPSLAAATTVEVGGAPMYPSKTIIENAAHSKNLSTLVAAVRAAGLVDTLSGKGPFTVFAPTDAAFDKLPDGAMEKLLKPENKERLARILACHVLAANAMSDVIKKMVMDDGGAHPVQTVGGCELTAKTKAGKIEIEDGQGNVANVTIADVGQSNGVIHVIDAVLLPAS